MKTKPKTWRCACGRDNFVPGTPLTKANGLLKLAIESLQQIATGPRNTMDRRNARATLAMIEGLKRST